jgi:hypothetical protein
MDWNEWEELEPTVETIQTVTRGMADPRAGEQAIRQTILARVRAQTPDWKLVADPSPFLASGRAAQFYQVRLSFEFDVDKAARDAGARFSYARCTARLWSAAGGAAQPRVYDLYPRDLYEGDPRTVKVEFGPEIKAADAGLSLGSLSTDISVGQVEPVVVAWKGDQEREPYWDLNPKNKMLLGLRNLWLLLQVPAECDGARLALRVEGDVEARWGPIPVAPKERLWDQRPSVLIR